jgi:hypothetical protein
MPCTKCENGKYKWGKTGECKYDSKEECEKANPKKYSKMKPTPLGKKSYEEYEKELKEFNLSKVERVELGLIDDALKFTKGVNVFGKNIDISEEELEKTFRSVKVDLEELQSDLNALKKGINEVDKQAKELGVAKNMLSTLPKYKQAIEAISYGEKQITKAKKLLK